MSLNVINLGDNETTYESDCPPETRFATLLCEGKCRATAKDGRVVTYHRWERNKKIWDNPVNGIRRSLRSTYNEFACAECGQTRTWGVE